MDPQYIYPAALGGPHLSVESRILGVVPVTAGSITDHRICAVHWHDYLQIWYTVSGSYYHTVNGVTTKEEPGSAILVFPHVPHSIDSIETDLSETRVIQINIKKDALESRGIPFVAHSFQEISFDALSLPSRLHFTGMQKARADALCTELREEYQKKQDINPYTMITLAADFLALCAEHALQRQSEWKLRSDRDRAAAINEAIAYLRLNLPHNISLLDVSGAAMMSRRSFTSGFRTVTGKGCGDCLRQLRMRRAVELLRKTDKTVAQIAEECGFYDASHFNKVCTDFSGRSPLFLRRELSQWTRDYGDLLYQRAKRNCGWALNFDEASEERHRFAMSFY